MLPKSLFKYLGILLFVFLTLEVFGQSCANYAVTRTTGITYSSISSSNPNYFVWRNTTSNQNDDNRTFQAPIGFDFWYLGVRYTHFSGNLNGIIDFSSSTSDGNGQAEYGPGHDGQFSSGGEGVGSLLALAPMYDDLWTAGSGSTPIASSCFYKTTGTAPNRVLTVEWQNFDEFNSSTGSLNFQVKLYEGTGVIAFEYGTMTLGTITPSFACGINNAWPAGVPTTDQLLTQQTVNTNTFSNVAQNGLSTMPESNSRLVFTPPTPSLAPTLLTFSAVTSGGMTLNWIDNASNEIGYSVYYSEDGINYDYAGQSLANSTSRIITGLQPSTLYTLKVVAVTDGGVSSELIGTRTTNAPSNITSIATGNWNATGTWSCSCIPSSGDNVTIANGHTVTLNTNGSANSLTVGGGTSGQLVIGNDATVRNLTLNGTLTINVGATVTIGALDATHTMVLKRDVVNNGTLNLAPSATRVCNVTFSRNGNQSVSGTGATTSFNNIVMNLGVIGNTLEVRSSSFTAPSGFLTMTRGIFKLSTGAVVTFATTAASIPLYTTLWVNHASATVNANGGTLTLLGALRASAGTINIGNASGHDLALQGGTVTVDGGNINLAGFFRNVGVSALMGLSISSGTFTICRLGSSTASTGSFNMDEVGSTLDMTGGSIIIQRAGAGNLAFLNTGGTLGARTGGTIQLGNASTLASQTLTVNSSQVIPNLTIGGAVALTCTPVTNNISIAGDLTVSSGSTFNLSTFTANRTTSGGILTVAGTLQLGNNTGGQAGSNFPNNFTSFVMTGGTVSYNLLSGGQTIYNLPAYNNLIAANTSLLQTAGGNLTVNGILTTTAGGTLNMSTFALGGSLTGVVNAGIITTQNTSLTPIPSGKTFAGTVNFNATTGGQTIPGNSYTSLTCGNSSGQQTLSGNILVTTLNHNTNANDTLNLSSFDLLAVTTINNTGIIRTQSTSATPVPSGKTWGSNFVYDNTAGGQTVMSGTYTNLKLSNTSGTQTASGALTINGSFITTAGGTLNMGTNLLSGTLSSIANNGTIRIQNTTASAIPSGMTWGGTMQFDGATQSIVGGTYNNLTLSGSGNKTMLVGTTTISGNFTMSGTASTSFVTNVSIGGNMTINTGTACLLSTFTANRATAGGTLTVGGVLILSATSGGQTGSNFPSNFTTISLTGSTVNYNASSGGQTVYSVPVYNTLTLVNSSGTQTAGGNLTVTTLNHNTNAAAILNMQSFTLTATTINNIGTIRTQNTSVTPIPSGLTIAGTVNYDAPAGGQTVVTGTYTNLSCGNTSGTQIPAGSFTVSGILLTTAGGTLNMGTLSLSGATGTITNNGTIRTQNTTSTPIPGSKTWAGTVVFEALSGGQTIPVGTFATLTLANTSGTQTASGALTVTTLNHNTSTTDTLNMATFALVVTTVNNTGTIRTRNSSGTPVSAGRTWGGNFIYELLTGGQTVMSGTYTNLTLSNTSGTQTASGTVTINGTLVTTSGGTLNMAGNQMLGTLSTVTSNAIVRTQNTSNPPIPNGKTWGGTVQFDGAAQTVSSGTYNNLTLAVSGVKTQQTGITVNGNFTMSGTASTTFAANISIGGDMNIGSGTSCALSTFTANRATTGGTLTVAGSLLLGAASGGQTGSNFPINYSTVTLTGGTVSYNLLAGGQTIYSVPTYTTLTCGNTSGTQTAGGNIVATTVNNNTNAADILNMQTFTLSATTVNNSGTIRTQNTTATPLPSGVTIAGTVSYNAASGGQTVMIGTYTNLTCGNTSGTQTAAGAFSVSGTLVTTAGGTLDMASHALSGALATITNNGTIRTQNASITPIPAAKTWGGTVIYELLSGGQTIMNGVYNNLTLANTSGTQTASGSVTINGTLVTTSGGTLNMVANQMLGTLSGVTSNGIVRTQNTSNPPIPNGKTWGGTVLFDGAAQTVSSGTYNNLTLAVSGVKTQQTGITVNGNFTMSGTASTTFAANISIGGDMNIGSGTSCTLSAFTANRATSGGALTVAGSLLLGGTSGGQSGSNFPINYTTISLAGGTVNYNATSGGQTIYSVPAYTTLTCGNTSGTQTAGGNIIATTVNNNTNIADSLNMQTFTLSATTVNNSGTIRTQNTTAIPLPSGVTIAGTVCYDAVSGGQSIMVGSYTNLSCGNTSGTQTAAGVFSVSGTLTTTAGGTLNMVNQALSGTLVTITNNGTIRTQNLTPTPIPTGRIWGGTIMLDAATGGQTVVAGTYTNLTCGNTSGRQTATGALSVSGTLTTAAGGTLNLADKVLSGALVTITNNGIIRTQNTSATPIPASKTWTGTVVFDATTGGQTIPESNSFATLTMGNTSGQQTTAGNLIVTTLNHNTNVSDSLNLSTFTLTVTNVNNTGTIRSQNTSGTPLSAGKTWGGRVVFEAAGSQTVSAGTYNNLTLASSGPKTTTSVTVNGMLSMEGTATSTATPNYGSTATLQYNTPISRNIGVECSNPFTSSGGIIIGNTGAIALNGPLRVNAPVVVNTGATFILGTNILNGSGSFTLNTGSTLQIGNLAGITSTGATGNIQMSGLRTYSAGANYIYNGGNTQVFGNGFPATVNNLIISNGNTAMALNSDQVVNGALSLSSGRIALGSNLLTLNGTLSMNAANCFVANGASSLSFGGGGSLGSNLFFDQTTQGTSNRLLNLTYNRNGASITLSNALQVVGSIIPSNGELVTGDFLTLVSNATATGRIAEGWDGTYISGNVTAERFIPSISRRWRFMSSPVIGSTLDDWQNEIFITGVDGAANGFDATSNNSASVYSYDETITTGNYNTGWTEASNTANTLQTGIGYRVFIRGDRSDLGRLNGTNNTQNAVTMNVVGNVHTGDIKMPVTFTSSGNIDDDGWNLLGNPYPCQLDWNLIHDEGRTGSSPDFSGTSYSHLDPTVSIYDPNTNAYSSYNANLNSGTGALSDGIIPSGAAFYVKATDLDPALTIEESHKSASTPAGVFKTQNDYFRVFLIKDSFNRDEMILAFKDEAEHGRDGFDIPKMYGGEVNLATKISDTTFLTADVKPFNGKSDTTILSVGIANSGKYLLTFNNPELLISGYKVWLVDQYLHKTQQITANYTYPFTVDVNNASTKGNYRFMIIVGEVYTGLNNPISISGFELFPTVTSDEITLLTQHFHGLADIVVTDVAGREVKVLSNQMVTSEGLLMNMNELKAGNYFLTIKNNTGLQQTLRFIRE